MKRRPKPLMEKPLSIEFEQLPLLQSREERLAVAQRQMMFFGGGFLLIVGLLIGRLI
ncbi:MAG: hypothetical protein QUV08_03165 [Parasphingorhabdus sp.]|nr:hypothetical protein [Parasphingorhabdus sp.]|tara:strand:- start:568 stop:738 length:171 start_codon:yes stop_codon:yes gene_type:complete